VDVTQSALPKGWEVADSTKSQISQRPRAPKVPPNGDDSLPVIKIAQLRAVTRKAQTSRDESSDSYIIENGDVLFSWSGSLLVDICAASWCIEPTSLQGNLRPISKVVLLFVDATPSCAFQNTAATSDNDGHIQRHH